MKKLLLVGMALVVVAVGGWMVISHASGTTNQSAQILLTTSPSPQTTALGSPSPSVSPGSAVKAYTMAQIATHGTSASCWTAINGSVYDLTSFINQHPGGPDRILSICGIDGSDAFNARHGGNSRPEQVLATMKIGIIAN